MGSKHAALIGCTRSDDGQTWRSVTPQKATCLAEPRAVPLHDVIISSPFSCLPDDSYHSPNYFTPMF